MASKFFVQTSKKFKLAVAPIDCWQPLMTKPKIILQVVDDFCNK